MKVTGVILAGGKSRRMGTPKALIPWRDGTLVEEVARRLGPVTSQLVVVTNDPDSLPPLEAEMVADIFPGRGPLAGLHAGLVHSPTPWILMVACDQPFLNRGFLEHLRDSALKSDFEALAPCLEGDLIEPLHAAYHRGIVPRLEAWLKEERSLKILDFYRQIRVRYLPPPEWQRFGTANELFFNINTPGDLARARLFFGETERQ